MFIADLVELFVYSVVQSILDQTIFIGRNMFKKKHKSFMLHLADAFIQSN